MFETRLLSSLSKVFADEELQDAAVKTGSCLRGEVYSFQVAYRSQKLVKGIEVEVASSLARHIEVRTVGLVPAEFLGARFDDDVLRTTPGLYPDPLYGLHAGVDAPPGQWRALWVQVRVPKRSVQGRHEIALRLGHGGRLLGSERPTVQLVQVKKDGDRYAFDFSRLDRWVKMADRCGVRYFEMAHLFTQWGAAHCPKIVATVNGRERKIFGWKDRAAGKQYRNFLDQFLPQLVRYLKKRGIDKRCYFHVSDEPHIDHLEAFSQAAAIVHEHLKGFPFIDALSNIEYYDRGLVRCPIPASNHIEPFVEKGVEKLWTYYCVSQWDQVANRFFCMPSARNRILGAQLYRYDLAGFLHWAFNFYFTQYSTRPLDPFVETDAGRAFPAGDAFLVYPGEDGPIDSIRGQVFREALQDQRALQLLEKLQGRDKTITLLERHASAPITMKRYPRGKAWLLAMRQRCNRRIAKLG